MTYGVANVIQGEAATPAGQFAVASVIYNRMQNGGFGGTDALSVANAPGQFTGNLTGSGGPGAVPSTTSSYAQQLANDLMSGNPPSGGTTGNALYFQSNQGQPSSVVGGSSVNIGGNYFSDRMGQPSSNFVAPQYGGSGGTIANGPADTSSGANPGTTDPLGSSVTVAGAPNAAGSTTTTASKSTTPLGSDAGTGAPETQGLQQGTLNAIQGWITNVESAFGSGLKTAVTAAETGVANYLGGLQNWFSRAGLILLGVVLIAIALVVLMWDHGGKATVVNLGKAAAA